ncbi:HEAT repeat domain-containing protein [Singulisphaera sp. PoT]|uniref:HEAT repeat domain-containing protein n=1 Tax=Singulisphaera sp. PoT TaxID=3411797 RepID=UPI003BF56256
MTKLVPALTILAVAAFGGLVLYRESPERLPEPSIAAVEPPLDGFIDRLARGDESQKLTAMAGLQLRRHTPAEFARTVEAWVGALGERSATIRERATSSLAYLLRINAIVALKTHEPPPMIVSAAPALEGALVSLLADPSQGLRISAVKALEELAADARLRTPPQGLINALERDTDLHVRIAAASAIVEYADGPELLLPIILKRPGDHHPALREASAHAIERVRLLPAAVPMLIEGLALEDEVLCVMCSNSLENIGREAAGALPALLALIRKEVDARWPRAVNRRSSGTVLGAAMKAFARICPPDGPLADEALPLYGKALERAVEGIRDPDDGVTPAVDRPYFTLKWFWREQILISLAALRALGHPSPAAAPILLEPFDTPRRPDEFFYPRLAACLFTVSRGTPVQARADASIRRAWRDEPSIRRDLAPALKRLGPEAERLIPDLKRIPLPSPEPQPPPPVSRRWRYDRIASS